MLGLQCRRRTCTHRVSHNLCCVFNSKSFNDMVNIDVARFKDVGTNSLLTHVSESDLNAYEGPCSNPALLLAANSAARRTPRRWWCGFACVAYRE